jgi:hypothetical protein
MRVEGTAAKMAIATVMRVVGKEGGNGNDGKGDGDGDEGGG